jgi:hypothetical protein
MGVCFSRPEVDLPPATNPPEKSLRVGHKGALQANSMPISHIRTTDCAEDDSSSLGNIVKGFPQRVVISGEPCIQIQETKTQRVHRIQGAEEPSERLLKQLVFSCVKGWKPEMPNQDDWCVIQDSDFTLVGVFDGHGKS